jgi:hypothetical protein
MVGENDRIGEGNHAQPPLHRNPAHGAARRGNPTDLHVILEAKPEALDVASIDRELRSPYLGSVAAFGCAATPYGYCASGRARPRRLHREASINMGLQTPGPPGFQEAKGIKITEASTLKRGSTRRANKLPEGQDNHADAAGPFLAKMPRRWRTRQSSTGDIWSIEEPSPRNTTRRP